MKKSSLFRVLGKLDAKEWKGLQQFLNSPFHTPNNHSAKLLEVLEKLNLSEGLQPGDARKIFAQAYPRQPYREAAFRKRIATLNQLVRNYLDILEHQLAPFESEINLLRQFRRKRLDHDFSLLRRKLLDTISQTPLVSGERDRLIGLIEKESDLLFGNLQERRFDQSLQARSDALDRSFAIQKLKMAVEMLNRRSIIEGSYDPKLLDPATQYLEQEELSKFPEVAAYQMIYQLIEGKGDFQALLQLLEEQQDSFVEDEVIELYKYAQNHCIRRINKGDTIFLKQLNQLYRKQLDSQLLWKDGYLKVDDYKNITAVALQLQDFEWTYEFLHIYRPYLREEQREPAFFYNLAYYYFKQQDFDQTIILLNQTRYPDIYYEISARFLLVRTYIQTKEYTTLQYLIDSFRLRIMRDKVMAPHYRKGVLNFLIQLKKVARLMEDEPFLSGEELRKKKSKIKTRIEGLDSLANKRWLLDLVT